MKNWSVLILLAAACGLVSCSKLQYIDQAFAVKAYSDEQDAMARDVARRDAQFEQLLEMVRRGEATGAVKTAAQLEGRWGPPVLKRDAPGKGWATWLYRYQLKRQGAKVYVLIRPDGSIDGFHLEE
ncbi:MAG: hypothetical protein WCO69_04155 [Candidatus Omnitrophota bacterium]